MHVRLTEVEVDLERRLVRRGSGAPLELHQREAELLAWFLAHPVRPAERALLLREVWGYRGRAHTRVVDVTVRRLREKIERDPSAPDHLLTVRGVGYRFEPPAAAAASELVGRGPLVARILQMSDEGGLVTVCGPPGIGKTAILDAIARSRPDVVRLGCDALRDAGELDARLASLAHPHRALLVDDIDHIAGAIARAIPALRARAVIVASYNPLGLAGERVVSLGPLDSDDAVRLYRQRAGAGDDAIAREICAVLGDLPLAIVLAAAQRPQLSEAALLARVRHAPLAIGADLGALPPRHRHLGRALAVGLEDMPARERRALAQLDVFAGWFEVDAAEAVIDAGPEARHDPPWAMILRWIRRGWIATDQPAPDRPLRGRLLPPLASCVRGALDDRCRAEAELRHAAYHALLQGEAALAHIDDLLLATERVTATSAPELAAACCAALASAGTPEDPRHRAQWQVVRSRWSRVRGQLGAALDLAAGAVRAARASGDDGVLASALYQLGLQHNLRAELTESRAALVEAEGAAGRAGHPALRARIRRLLAVDRMESGQAELALALLLAADADLRAADAPRADRAEHDVITGLCALARGRHDEARQRLQAADAWYAEAGNRLRRAWTRNNLGEVERHAGDLEEAEAHYRAAQALFRDSGVDEVVAEINLVLCAAARGRIDELEALVEETRGRAIAQGRAARIALLELARAVIATPSRPELASGALAEASARLSASGYVDPDLASLAELGAARAESDALRTAFAALASAQRGAPS